MPHFSLTFSESAPIVNMVVGVSAARAQALTAGGLAIPQAQNIRALVDTGASGTCIDPMIFTALQLAPTGTIPVLTPSTGATPVDADVYDVSVFVPNGPQAGLLIQNMPVAASELFVAQGFHALLGRDILRRCVLTYNGAIELLTFAY